MPKKAQEIIPSEDTEQQMLFTWAAMSSGKYPELMWMYACPNGGLRHIQTAMKLKDTGVKAGVPDIFLPVARHKCHGMYIEMKRRKGGKLSVYQKEWITELTKQGYYCVVAHGFEEAREQIEKYLKG